MQGLSHSRLKRAGLLRDDWRESVLQQAGRSEFACRILEALCGWRLGEIEPPFSDWSRKIEEIRSNYLKSSERLVGIRKEGEYEKTSVTWTKGKPRLLREVVRHSSNLNGCRLLYSVTAAARAKRVLELGTCVGISTAYLAAAARAQSGTVITIEGAADFSAQGKKTLLEAGLAEQGDFHVGLIEDELPEILARGERIDVAFVDGHHDGSATVRYTDMIRPNLAAQAVMVLDDIRWSEGMKNAWDQVRHDGGIPLTVDLGPIGICIFAKDLEKVNLEWKSPRNKASLGRFQTLVDKARLLLRGESASFLANMNSVRRSGDFGRNIPEADVDLRIRRDEHVRICTSMRVSRVWEPEGDCLSCTPASPVCNRRGTSRKRSLEPRAAVFMARYRLTRQPQSTWVSRG